MLRSKLILKIAGVNEQSVKLCAVVEMIHAASLLHDDVIDEADTRRGEPSVNALYDNKTSIMFGDILYSKAFTQLTFMDKKIAYTVSNAVTLLSIGEMLDVDLTNSFNHYINVMIDLKRPLFTVKYPSTDPLEKAMQEYTDSVIAFIENGDCELPTTRQHVGTDPLNCITNNLFKIRVHNINYSNFYKVYIYIDTKNITNVDTTNVSLAFVTFLKDHPTSFIDNYTINQNSISFFNSTNVKIDNSTKYFDGMPSGNNTVKNYNNVSQTMPGDICRNNNSNNRFLLQQQYTGVQKREKYAAPEYLAINKETTNSDNTDIYTTQELIGQGQINIDYFTLDTASNILNNSWDADIHIVSKYVFLDEDERTKMAKQSQSYLIKTIYEEEIPSLLVPNTIKINSKDLVVNYTWAFRRNDVFLRNEWSNYTNWEFIDVPNTPLSNSFDGVTYPFFLTPYVGVGTTNNTNKKTILQSLSIFVDGKMRENLFEQGVYNHLEKYLKCAGKGKDGQFFYSFALNNNPSELQPSGRMNLSRFNDITFQFTLIETPDDPSFDPANATRLIFQQRPNGSAPICVESVTKKDEIKLYSFDMRTFQERYNVIIFKAGMAGLMYSDKCTIHNMLGNSSNLVNFYLYNLKHHTFLVH